MSGKNQYPTTANWQTTDPSIGFLPTHNQGGSTPSGTLSGTMSSTNTIYSQIFDVSKMDNNGFIVNWTGTPTGTLQVKVANADAVFSALTFSPTLAQPSGSAGFYSLSLNQLPFKYFMFVYTNASGSGVLTISGQHKDLN